jgi:hypothetical protein
VASYRVQVWSTSTTDFSTDVLVAEFENPKNLGYGSYLNDIGEAFFTVSQYDVKANLKVHEGKAHVFIIRQDGSNEDVVWRGILSEHDANERDVIFYCYGYEHFLFSLHTKWKTKWRNVAIAGATGRPIDDTWARAKALTDSPLQWVTTGTLQAPWVSNAQTTALTLNRYRVNWKPILTVFKELVAIATSDTDNICFFEIDYPTDPTDHSATFNFWRHNSTDATKLRLEYPNNIMDWSDRFVPVMLRNKILAVGTGPRNQLYRYQKTRAQGSYGRSLFGLHSKNMYLSWVRDRKELKRVTARRLKLGLKEDTNVWVRCWPGSIPPHRASTSDWELGDLIFTKAQHGTTQIAKKLLLIGEQTVFVNGREYVQPMLEDRGIVTSEFSGWTWHGPTATTPWTINMPAADSDTRSIAIPADARIAVFCGAYADHNGSPITGVTLNGVAMTRQVSSAGAGVFNRFAEMFVLGGASLPYGETVDMVVTYDSLGAAGDYGYGLATAAAGVFPAPLADTSVASATSGGLELTLDSGLKSGVGIVCGVKAAAASASMKTNSEELVDSIVGIRYMYVHSEIAATTGSREVGGDGNTAYVSVGVMLENEE